MKRLFSLLVVLFVTCTRFAIGQPKIEVIGGTDFDFGGIYQGSKVEHIFELKNSGSDTLRIGKVETSCGCTAALLSTSTIPPLSTGKVSVSFNSAGYGGSVSKSVFIHSNDTSQSLVTLHVNMTILVELEIQPAYVGFSDVKVGESTTSNVLLKNVSGKKIKLLEVSDTEKYLKVDFPRQTLDVGQSTPLTVTLTGPKAGPLYGSIRIRTDSSVQHDIEIKYFGNVVE